MNEKSTWFKIAISVDRLFNVLTGGDIGTCFSTRTYVNSIDSRKWAFVMGVIDRIFWDGHCKDSLKWELRKKQEWIHKYKYIK